LFSPLEWMNAANFTLPDDCQWKFRRNDGEEGPVLALLFAPPLYTEVMTLKYSPRTTDDSALTFRWIMISQPPSRGGQPAMSDAIVRQRERLRCFAETTRGGRRRKIVQRSLHRRNLANIADPQPLLASIPRPARRPHIDPLLHGSGRPLTLAQSTADLEDRAPPQARRCEPDALRRVKSRI
jgi:hypothetical protein